ncbi:MAG: 3-oxoacyl-[acyl-carrier-protein] reductase [Candidatus Omnitrophica bacterium]|nr:3-oxoacyl-[acyl-carrier-protein] reductase [Candidatus Omnitrophota bacterium]
MEQKVAIVTGGTRGIGRAIVERFLREGFQVYFTGRSQESVSRADGGIGRVCDGSDPAAVKELFETVVREAGRLDVLVNNAAITRDGLILRMKPEHWDEVLAANLRSAFLCSQAAARPMMKNEEGGRIINVTSVVGVVGNAGQANYSASKAGLIGLTKSLAKELASRKILVNAVAPGFIETDMTKGLSDEVRKAARDMVPLARFGSPEDVAGVCSFLAGPDSVYVTGQVLHVDGGMVM